MRRLVFVAIMAFVLGVFVGRFIAPRILLARAVAEIGFLRRKVDAGVLDGKRVMVLLAAGQSNAGNAGGSPRVATTEVYNWYDGKLYRARDPLRGADGIAGSIWTRLADSVVRAALYDAVVIAVLSRGNTPIDSWAAGSPLDAALRSTIRGLIRDGLSPTHIVWVQGEADARSRTPTGAYLQQLRSLIRRIRASGATAPIYIVRSTRCYYIPPSANVRDADSVVAATEPDVFLGPDTDQLDKTVRAEDECHFSDRGLDSLAKLWIPYFDRRR